MYLYLYVYTVACGPTITKNYEQHHWKMPLKTRHRNKYRFWYNSLELPFHRFYKSFRSLNRHGTYNTAGIFISMLMSLPSPPPATIEGEVQRVMSPSSPSYCHRQCCFLRTSSSCTHYGPSCSCVFFFFCIELSSSLCVRACVSHIVST